MLAAARTIFVQFHTARVIAAVLLGGVIAFLTLGAGQVNDWADVFLRCHNVLLYAKAHKAQRVSLLMQ
ncbi:MAG: hypothetical protein A2Z49_12995 [Chloroflexi bacterium RBG_19FT_COMBO_56_12]|nr:MAG: hypothetical protein A2W36_04245 [Chloroflexi bacterium RBG_16_58_14]OGO69456.1 MAG: hypothetical protein A2Z49_12995 [Chloroflexi bacterium RBG_19FT_COMBO_56_12]